MKVTKRGRRRGERSRDGKARCCRGPLLLPRSPGSSHRFPGTNHPYLRALQNHRPWPARSPPFPSHRRQDPLQPFLRSRRSRQDRRTRSLPWRCQPSRRFPRPNAKRPSHKPMRKARRSPAPTGPPSVSEFATAFSPWASVELEGRDPVNGQGRDWRHQTAGATRANSIDVAA